MNFLGNAPTEIASSPWGSGASFTIHVREGSTGWGVDIPGTWMGMPIVYGIEYTAAATTAGGGSVSGAGDVGEGETVSLKATPEKGYVFVGWGGDISSTDTELSFVVDRDVSVTAAFVPEAVADAFVAERAAASGYYTEDQLRSLSAGDLFLDMDAATGSARVGFSLMETTDLSDPDGWKPVELSREDLDIGEDGTVGLSVKADADAKFFRLVVP